MTCDRTLDAGAYALQAMEDREAQAFELHLEDCEACRHHVAELRPVVDALPMAAPQLSAPPELKGRLMAVVEREAELLRAAGPEADRVPEPARARRRWSLGVRPLTAALAACSLLAAGVVTGLALTGGDDAAQVRTVAAQAPSSAKVAVELDEDGHAELVMEGMPSAPVGRVYQVWLARDGKPEPTHTLFSVAKDGEARVAIDESVRGAKQVLVTAEPAGGSKEPTQAPLVIATLS